MIVGLGCTAPPVTGRRRRLQSAGRLAGEVAVALPVFVGVIVKAKRLVLLCPSVCAGHEPGADSMYRFPPGLLAHLSKALRRISKLFTSQNLHRPRGDL